MENFPAQLQPSMFGMGHGVYVPPSSVSVPLGPHIQMGLSERGPYYYFEDERGCTHFIQHGFSLQSVPTNGITITEGIWREEVALPRGPDNGKTAFMIHNVLTRDECMELIRTTEEKGYRKAQIYVGNGFDVHMTQLLRKSFRCVLYSKEKAEKIWKRIENHLPTEWHGRRVVGLNERLRVLRYDGGEFFRPHRDSCYSRDNGEKSFFTIMIYLNEGFTGGSTAFLSADGRERREVVPRMGSVLVFEHNILHEGCLLQVGRKYAIRTDLMFAP